MKLRNKKTGEIDDFIFKVIIDRINLYRRVAHSETKNVWYYNSLAELNEEWEDYKEIKGWYIDVSCAVRPAEPFFGAKNIKILKQCGNYFETKEEAEKAVEKLKAWKRLKDKGFRFELWDFDGGNYNERINTGKILFRVSDSVDDKDLDLLFGGDK